MAGVSNQGFETKSLEDIRNDMGAALKTSLGESIRLDAKSVLGQIRDAFAVESAEAWEALAELVEIMDPDQGAEVFLDAIVALSGVSPRLEAQPSTGTITITGTPSTSIPAGAQAKDADTGVTVETLVDVTIPGGGSVDVAVQATETGPLEAAAGTITTIVTPYAGWASVTNAAKLTPGRNIESDLELRARREASLQGTGTGTDGGLRAALLEIVEQVVILSNRSNTTAADGTPPHAVRTVVYPDPASTEVEKQIATAIFEQLPAGIEAYGTDVTAVVTDTQGVDHTVWWDYATAIPVYIQVNVFIDPSSTTTTDEVKDAIIAYVDALTMGDDVRVLRLQAIIQGVDSLIEGVTIVLDTIDPPVGTVDISIDFDEVAVTDAAKVSVVFP